MANWKESCWDGDVYSEVRKVQKQKWGNSNIGKMDQSFFICIV